MSSCEETTLDRISRPSTTTAAAVSSHEDSIPKMRVGMFRFSVFRSNKYVITTVKDDSSAKQSPQCRHFLCRCDDTLHPIDSIPPPRSVRATVLEPSDLNTG